MNLSLYPCSGTSNLTTRTMDHFEKRSARPDLEVEVLSCGRESQRDWNFFDMLTQQVPLEEETNPTYDSVDYSEPSYFKPSKGLSSILCTSQSINPAAYWDSTFLTPQHACSLLGNQPPDIVDPDVLTQRSTFTSDLLHTQARVDRSLGWNSHQYDVGGYATNSPPHLPHGVQWSLIPDPPLIDPLPTFLEECSVDQRLLTNPHTSKLSPESYLPCCANLDQRHHITAMWELMGGIPDGSLANPTIGMAAPELLNSVGHTMQDFLTLLPADHEWTEVSKDVTNSVKGVTAPSEGYSVSTVTAVQGEVARPVPQRLDYGWLIKQTGSGTRNLDLFLRHMRLLGVHCKKIPSKANYHLVFLKVKSELERIERITTYDAQVPLVRHMDGWLSLFLVSAYNSLQPVCENNGDKLFHLMENKYGRLRGARIARIITPGLLHDEPPVRLAQYKHDHTGYHMGMMRRIHAHMENYVLPYLPSMRFRPLKKAKRRKKTHSLAINQPLVSDQCIMSFQIGSTNRNRRHQSEPATKKVVRVLSQDAGY